MTVDPSQFHQGNVADTCAVWNVLSSELLHQTACQAGCLFCCTIFVEYECLHKPRKKPSPQDDELRQRLNRSKENGSFRTYPLDLADLHDVMLLENRKRLGKGELSSIAFALKTRQAFLTDDRGARKLAEKVMPQGMVQTTPHLFGWLLFTSQLSDGDKVVVIEAHEKMNRPLRISFEESYMEALRCRLMARPRDGGRSDSPTTNPPT